MNLGTGIFVMEPEKLKEIFISAYSYRLQSILVEKSQMQDHATSCYTISGDRKKSET